MPSGIQARLLITLIFIRPNSWDLCEWPGGRVVRTSRVKGWKAHSCCFLALTAQHQWFLGNSLMKPNCRKPSSDHFSTVHGKMREGQLGDWMKSSTPSSTPPIYVHINGAEQTLRNLSFVIVLNASLITCNMPWQDRGNNLKISCSKMDSLLSIPCM